MKERKYRALTIKDRQLVYGWYCLVEGKECYIILEDVQIADEGPRGIEIAGLIEVYPETVSLSIGLNDINHKEIYGSIFINGQMSKGGDIVEAQGKHKCRALVKYAAPSFKYFWSDGVTTIDNVAGWNDFKIIGNQAQNPDLLENKQDSSAEGGGCAGNKA